MEATLNYKATNTGGTYSYLVYFSIESGSWYANIVSSSGAGLLSARNELGITSTFVSCEEGDILTVDVAKTDVSNTYYHATYTATGGSISASEHNISATITSL